MTEPTKRKRQTQYWSAVPDPDDFTEANREAAWDGDDSREPAPDDDDWVWAHSVYPSPSSAFSTSASGSTTQGTETAIT